MILNPTQEGGKKDESFSEYERCQTTDRTEYCSITQGWYESSREARFSIR